MAVVGSGIAAQRLSPGDAGLQLLENSLVTGAALVALILALQPVSASFNPVVTAIERVLGLVTTREAALSGGCPGVRRGGRLRARQPDVRARRRLPVGPRPHLVRHAAGRGRRHGRVGRHRLRQHPRRSTRDGRLRGRRLHHCGVLVHQLHQLRQPRGHPGSHALRHVRRHRAGVGAGLRPDAGRGRRGRPRARRYSCTRPEEPPHDRPRRLADRPTVLFVCVHNAGRSQMAAGYLQHLAGDRIDVLSAGSQPADQVNPAAVEAMAEEGIDIAAEQPKLLTDSAVQTADVVITMGCGDECPFYPGKRYEDWVLDDPAGQGVDAVRPIRDEIRDARRRPDRRAQRRIQPDVGSPRAARPREGAGPDGAAARRCAVRTGRSSRGSRRPGHRQDRAPDRRPGRRPRRT